MAPPRSQGWFNAVLAAGGTVAQAITQFTQEATKNPAAGTLAATLAPWLGPIGVIAGALGGYGLNRLASHADRTSEWQHAAAGLLENEHLARVASRALQRRLEVVSAEQSVPVLGRVGARAHDWWPALVRGQVESVRALADNEIATRVAETLTGRPSAGPTAADWRAVLDFAFDVASPTDRVNDHVLGFAASQLEEHALHDIAQALIGDPATGGEAFASVVLRFLSQQLFAIQVLTERVDASVEATAGAMQELREALRQGAIASSALQLSDLTALFEAQTRRFEARFDALEEGQRNLNAGMELTLEGISGLHETAGQLHRKTDQVLEHLGALRPAERRASDNLALAGAGPNDAFVGRATDLDTLATLLDDPAGPRAVAIVAGAGYGKTELAKAFVHRRTKPRSEDPRGWDGRWWIDGSAGGELASLVSQFHVITGREPPQPPKTEERTDASRSQREWIRLLRRSIGQACAEGRHLVILDNAESPDQIRDYRPVSSASRLLATTRRQPIPVATARAFPLDVLAPTEAAQLLTSGRGDLRDVSHEAAIRRLADYLGHHPLAVAYAAAALSRPPRRSPSELLDGITRLDVGDEGHVLSDLGEEALGSDYALPLARSLGLLMDELSDPQHPAHDPLALRLAGLLAFCDPREVPLALLQRVTGEPSEAIDRAVLALHERSIVTADTSITLHRLTQSLVRSRLKREGTAGRDAAIAGLVAGLIAIYQDYEDHTLSPLRTACWAHAEAVLRHAALGADTAALRVHLSSHLQEIGMLASSRSHIDAALDWGARQAPVDERSQAIWRATRAGIRQDLGEAAGALEDITWALDWGARQTLVNERGQAIWRATRARIRQNRGALAGALEDITWALDWAARQTPVDERSQAIRRATRAGIRQDLGALAGALEDITWALDWAARQTPVNERSQAIWRATRAGIRQDRGEVAGALEDIAWALDWAARQTPVDERSQAICRATRARIRRGQGDAAGALYDINWSISWAERQTPINERQLAAWQAIRDSIG